jgi:hypothetical protein
MVEFMRHEKDTEQELLLETDSDGANSSDSDKDTDTKSGHNEDSATVHCASENQVHV